MAQLQQPFNANEHDPSQSAGQMPIGQHKVVIESSEMQGNSQGTGGFLLLNLKVIEGPNAGATGPYRLNLYHTNEKAVRVAQSQLSAICHATGVFMLSNSEQLHGIPFAVEVGLQKDPEAASKGYTEVKRVFDVNGNEPGKAAGQQAQKPAPQQPAQQPAPAQAGWGQPAAQPSQPASQPAWGAAQQAPAQTQPAAQPAWGQQQPTGQPAQQAAPAWGAQGPAQGGQPAWGQ